ncbi:hypothetical protein BH09MYX1_BH09MYX1_09300 [soil metagenome]
MQARFRVLGGFVAAICFTVVTLSLAKPPAPATGPKPKPKPSATVEAGATTDNPYGDDSGASSSLPIASDASGANASSDSGPVAPPQMIPGLDGGVRMSPLNPAPNEFPGPIADAGTYDYDKLLGDIAALRARVAAVGDNLFHARIAINVRTDESHGKLGRLVISLDDGAVYTAPAGFKADDMTPIYAHAVAAGRHAITVDVERKDDRNDAFKSTQRSRFIVEVPKDQELKVEFKIIDDSDMGAFGTDNSGGYDLRVRMKAEAKVIKK